MEPILYLLFFLLIILLIVILTIYNSLIKKRNAVKQSHSTIDVYLNQRFDLIPNLVETVRAYAKHEENLLKSITELRTKYNENKNLDTASVLNNQMNKLIVSVENYPELKSSENFLNLQKNLTKMEDQLQAARRLYNMDVTNYNTSIQTFPTNILANIFKFNAEKLFEIEPEKAKNINIDL